MTINFTKKTLDNIPFPQDGKRITYKDTKNGFLTLRVSKSTKVFYYYRKINGKARKIKIGNYPEINQHQARQKCDSITKEMVTGNLNIATQISFSDLFDLYINRYARLHRKSFSEDKRYFDNYLNEIHNKRADKITKDDIISLQANFATNNGKYTANRIIQMIRAIYNWGINNNLIYCKNPATNIKLFKERSRERFLSPAEINSFFEAIEECRIDNSIKDFLKLAVFTGQRKSNLLAMRWKDIDIDEKLWTIPGEFMKNGEQMKAILADQAIEILLNRIDVSYKSDYVFPGKKPDTHLQDPKASWKKIKEKAGLTNLRLHDLRRTLGSWQAIQGSSLITIGKSLGHKSSQATEVYARLNNEAVKNSVNKAVNSMLQTIKDNNEKSPNNIEALKTQLQSLSQEDRQKLIKELSGQ